MRFFLDQDVPIDVARVLQRAGHDVVLLKECLPVTATDGEVLRYSTEQDRILITCNRDDFLELAREEPFSGIIILIRRKSRVQECAKVLSLLDRAGETGLWANINFA